MEQIVYDGALMECRQLGTMVFMLQDNMLQSILYQKIHIYCQTNIIANAAQNPTCPP